MKVLIVEDETAASENLIAMLTEYDSSIEIVKVLESVGQTVRWLGSNEEPDLIFMDIHLSDGLAFTLFDQIDVKTPIIFTTAYDKYALDAFAVNSIDYLLKPIKSSNLERALNKYKRWSQSDVNEYIERMMSLELKKTSNEYKKSLLVHCDNNLVPLNVDNIVCIYSKERNIQLYTKDNQVFQYNKSLDSIISDLDPNFFFRANKQFIIAKDGVKNIVVWFDSRLKIEMTVDLPETIFVSKNRASEFKSWVVG